MPRIAIQNATPDHYAHILALNDTEVQQTSAMDLARLRELDALSCYHKVARVDGLVAAFLLAMRDGAAYANDNYAWFAERFAQFVYVDRIVVSSAFGGLGVGSLLYADLFAYARTQHIDTIACEYNVEPPNPASRRFHDKFGFNEIGQQWVANRTKRVSMQVSSAPGLAASQALPLNDPPPSPAPPRS